MKAITLGTTLMLLGSLTLAMADATIDEQITAIKNAPAQERVQLMNRFKERLAAMNESEREEAITQLRTQMQTRQQDNTAEGEQSQTRTQTQERNRMNQMQQTEQMQRMQEMQQQNREQLMQGSMDKMQQNMQNQLKPGTPAH
jgi:hypothetical protein